MTEVAEKKFPRFAARMIGDKIISFDFVKESVTVPAHVDVTINRSDDAFNGCLLVNNHYFNYPLKLGAGIDGDLLRKAVLFTDRVIQIYHAYNPIFDKTVGSHFGNLVNPVMAPPVKDESGADRILLALRMFTALGDSKLLESYIGKGDIPQYSALTNKEVHEVVGPRVLKLIIGEFDTTGPVAWETMPLEAPVLALTRPIYDWVLASKIKAPAITDKIIKLPWDE